MDLRTIVEEARKTSPPSLKTLCVIRYASELCNQKEIRDLLKTLKYPNYAKVRLKLRAQTQWKMINKIIVDKLNSLLIPKTLKDDVLSYSFSITVEILKWSNAHQHQELPEEFCWTVKGTIDYKNTAEMIVQNESQCIKKRYKLSCIYCLETFIFLLWIEMSFKDKNDLLNDFHNPLVSYWLITMCAPKEKARLFNLENVYQKAFLYALNNGFIDAVKCLFYKLSTYNQRQIFLDKIFMYMITQHRGILIRIPEVNEADTWFYLYSHMSENLQQKFFFHIHSFGIVSQMFLNSSRQKHLVKVLNLAGPNLNECHYRAIGFSVLYKYMLGYKDCNYKKIFVQFWREMSSSDRKRLFKESKLGIWLFTYLLRTHFIFLLKKGTLKSKSERISEYLKSIKLKSHGHFDRDNWKFLLFLIKDEVVTWNFIKRYQGCFFKALGIRIDREIALKKIAILIRRIRSNKKRNAPQINPPKLTGM